MARSQQGRLFLAILAGGASRRAGRSDGSSPKQFREVGGRMLCMHALRELARAPGVVHAVVVVPDAWRRRVERALHDADDLPIGYALASAGAHRTASAWSALQHLASLPEPQRPTYDDLVAIHDAARPFATRLLLARLAQAAMHHGVAVPAVPVTDTIVQLSPGEAAADIGAEVSGAPGVPVGASYLQRHRLVAVQTPQVARWRELYEAHAWAAATG